MISAARMIKMVGAVLAAAPILIAIAPARAAGVDDARAITPSSPAAQEGLEILRRLIRLDTVNPPGNEAALLREVAALLERDGIPSEIAETAPGRAVLRAVLPAARPGAGAILLLAHVDTVGFERKEWSLDPLAAGEKDGAVYGRGAIDDKGMAAAAIETLLVLKRSQRPRARDVVLLLVGDEEAGGRMGIGWVARNRPGWLKGIAGALNEGGRVIADESGRVLWIGLQSSEKRSFNLELIARGTTGHASLPKPDNAMYRLAAVLERLSRHEPLPRTTPETKAFFRGLASVSEPGMAEHLNGVVDLVREKVRAGGTSILPRYEERTREGPHVLAVSANPIFRAMLRDTAIPTLLSGGIRANVLPPEARATLNCRILPDTTPEAFVAELKAAAGESEGVEWRLPDDLAAAVPASPLEGIVPGAVRDAAAGLWPKAPVLPYLSPGATDSGELRRAGIPSYGLLPFPLTLGDLDRMHGNDERLPIASFAAGLDLLLRSVERAAAAPSGS